MEAITTIASVPAIIAIVNLLKDVGLSGKWSAIVAVALGVLLNVAVGLFGDTALFSYISSGAIIGFGAAGLYDVTKTNIVVNNAALDGE